MNFSITYGLLRFYYYLQMNLSYLINFSILYVSKEFLHEGTTETFSYII